MSMLAGCGADDVSTDGSPTTDGSATIGTAGTQTPTTSKQTTSDRDGTPSPGGDDPSGGSNELNFTQDRPSFNAISGRPLYTESRMNLYVDPENGSNANSGSTPKDALESVNGVTEDGVGAMGRVPYLLFHDVTINLADGLYATSPKVSSNTWRISVHACDAGVEFTIEGNRENPENVQIGEVDRSHIGLLHTTGGKQQHHRFLGLAFNGYVQSYGKANIRDCIFRGSDGGPCIGGYDMKALIKDCYIGNPGRLGADYGIYAFFNGSNVHVENGTIDVKEASSYQPHGGRVSFQNVDHAGTGSVYSGRGGGMCIDDDDLYIGSSKTPI